MEIVSALIGGFLAAGTGWFLQSRLEKARLKRARELFYIGIADDLANTIELMDRLAEDWEKSKIVWFSTISEIGDSRHTYNNNKDWITLIEDEDLRKSIARYYRRSANHLLQLQNAQQRKHDIDGSFNSLVRDLRMREPELLLEHAQRLVAQSMDAESTELTYLNEQIPTLIHGLERFKTDAREILGKLRAT